jgi:hypothetical protein
MDYAMDPRVVDALDPAVGGVSQVKAALAALPTVSIALKQSDLTEYDRRHLRQRQPAWHRLGTTGQY